MKRRQRDQQEDNSLIGPLSKKTNHGDYSSKGRNPGGYLPEDEQNATQMRFEGDNHVLVFVRGGVPYPAPEEEEHHFALGSRIEPLGAATDVGATVSRSAKGLTAPRIPACEGSLVGAGGGGHGAESWVPCWTTTPRQVLTRSSWPLPSFAAGVETAAAGSSMPVSNSQKLLTNTTRKTREVAGAAVGGTNEEGGKRRGYVDARTFQHHQNDNTSTTKDMTNLRWCDNIKNQGNMEDFSSKAENDDDPYYARAISILTSNPSSRREVAAGLEKPEEHQSSSCHLTQFPYRLHRMLEAADAAGFSDIVSWLPPAPPPDSGGQEPQSWKEDEQADGFFPPLLTKLQRVTMLRKIAKEKSALVLLRRMAVLSEYTIKEHSPV